MSTDRSEKTRPYYVHASKKKRCGCTNYVPAADLEAEIFSRLGDLLRNAEHFASAVRATVAEKPEDVSRLQAQLERVRADQKRARRVLENAMAVLIEARGSEAALIAKRRAEEQEALLAKLKEEASQIEGALKVTQLPADFSIRVEQITKRLVGLNGHAPMLWPYEAKRALLAMFFGGPKSTRFDREAPNRKSDQRGIFLQQQTTDAGKRYWTYDARGGIANLSGAITRVVSLYDEHVNLEMHRPMSKEQLVELCTMAERLEGYLSFRVSPPASRPRSA